jgi:6-phosphofructokinase 1
VDVLVLLLDERPEEVTDIPNLVKELKAQNKGRRSSIVIVAEGDDGGGAKDIMDKVKPFLPEFDLRHSVLGHIQRGGNPSALDRIIATRMGSYSIELLREGKSNIMIGVYGENLSTCSIEQGIKEHATPMMTKLDLLKTLRTQ